MLRNIFAFALVGLLSHQTHAFSTLPALSTLSRGGFVSARMTSQKVCQSAFPLTCHSKLVYKLWYSRRFACII